MIYLAHARYILSLLVHAQKTSEGDLRQEEKKIPFPFLIPGFPMVARVIRLDLLDETENSILIQPINGTHMHMLGLQLMFRI